MFGKNVIFFVFLAVIAANTVFSQSVSTEGKTDYRNDGLILYKDAAVYEDDYTTGDRVAMGVLNMFFGVGSIFRGHKSGYLITTLDIIGVSLIMVGAMDKYSTRENTWGSQGIRQETVTKDSPVEPGLRGKMLTTGILTVCGGVILGYLLPLSYHKPGATRISQGDFPFNIEPAFANNGEIDGLRICYSIEY